MPAAHALIGTVNMPNVRTRDNQHVAATDSNFSRKAAQHCESSKKKVDIAQHQGDRDCASRQ